MLPRPTAHWRNCTEPRERAGQLFCIMSVRVTSKSVNARLHYEAIDCELCASERIAVRRQRFSTRTEDAIRQHFGLAPGTCSVRGKMRYGARTRRVSVFTSAHETASVFPRRFGVWRRTRRVLPTWRRGVGSITFNQAVRNNPSAYLELDGGTA